MVFDLYKIRDAGPDKIKVDGREYDYVLSDPSVIGLSLSFFSKPHNETIEVKNAALKKEVVKWLVENKLDKPSS